jgi:nicotinamidase-related amidase
MSDEPIHPDQALVVDSATALLIVDMQNELMHPDGKYFQEFPVDPGSTVDAVRLLVSWARKRELRVIWQRLAFRPGHFDAVFNSMSRKTGNLRDGAWGAELMGGLGREEEDVVITRKRPSGFFDTDLNIVLRGLGIRRLVVTGGSTHWAVESTVRDGHSHDYKMFVVREAVIDPFPDFHEASLRSMGSVFATVLDLDEVVEA